MLKINCDIGERGFDHPVDTELMKHIHIANIACGGHAGDIHSVKAFRHLAKDYGVMVTAHLSYPDKENFGRKTIEISPEDLLRSLDEQYSLMPDVKSVKFHGALYNDCASDTALAVLLTSWLSQNGISNILTQFDSELAKACAALGIQVVGEAFAERNYAYNSENQRLTLAGRDKDYASIHDLDQALAHSRAIYKNQMVMAYTDKDMVPCPLEAQTICIHSDSNIALDLAQGLKAALE